MRVSIIGQAAFGAAVLSRLEQDNVEITAVSAPQPAEGVRPDPLWAAAAESGFACVDTRSLKDPAGLAQWAENGADLCVMAFVTEILPEQVFSLPTHGTIQYHPSLLPLHRGISSMNWPIIFGEQETGLTVFWPDQGIDTGPILLQKRQPIAHDDTMGSLYFDHLFPMGVDAVSEAVALVAQGRVSRQPQQHELATYEPPCRDEHARIPWHEPAGRVYDLIRGCNPQPGSWTTFEGQRLRIFDCRQEAEHAPGMPGRILHVDESGFDVRLNGGVLHVLRVQPEGAKKLPAAEWASAVGLREGARLR